MSQFFVKRSMSFHEKDDTWRLLLETIQPSRATSLTHGYVPGRLTEMTTLFETTDIVVREKWALEVALGETSGPCVTPWRQTSCAHECKLETVPRDKQQPPRDCAESR